MPDEVINTGSLDANNASALGAASVGLNYIEYFSKMKKDCGKWKELALANKEDYNLMRYYAVKWNEALALFKKQFHIIIPDTM